MGSGPHERPLRPRNAKREKEIKTTTKNGISNDSPRVLLTPEEAAEAVMWILMCSNDLVSATAAAAAEHSVLGGFAFLLPD